jgi:hypothetical protein
VIEMQKKLRSGSWIGAVMAVVLLGGPVVGSAWAGGGARIVDPHPKTIVRITGDAANGFGIHYFDGTADFPPTDSEARAECGEYDTRVERVRCRTQVRTWYYALGDTQKSIRYYKALLREAER